MNSSKTFYYIITYSNSNTIYNYFQIKPYN